MGAEPRGQVIRGLFVQSTRMSWEELCERAEIVRKAVWDFKAGGVGGIREVKANKGAPGVDGCSIEEFEVDLKNNLYKIWSASS